VKVNIAAFVSSHVPGAKEAGKLDTWTNRREVRRENKGEREEVGGGRGHGGKEQKKRDRRGKERESARVWGCIHAKLSRLPALIMISSCK